MQTRRATTLNNSDSESIIRLWVTTCPMDAFVCAIVSTKRTPMSTVVVS